MLKILQARLQQYMNHELPDIQAGFRKGRGTRDQIVNICSLQFSSVAQSCPSLYDPKNCSTPGLPVHHQLPESTQTHVHWIGDAIQPSQFGGSSKKQESSRKTSISALLSMPKLLTVWITINCGKVLKRWEYQTTWSASWKICMQVRKLQLELDMEQQIGSK